MSILRQAASLVGRYRKQFVVDDEAVTLEILDTAGQGTSSLLA